MKAKNFFPSFPQTIFQPFASKPPPKLDARYATTQRSFLTSLIFKNLPPTTPEMYFTTMSSPLWHIYQSLKILFV